MPVPGGVTRESDPQVISVESLEIKLSDDADKKLLVGNWAVSYTHLTLPTT